MFLWQEICATRAQTSFLAASWEGASATGEWYVTSYNLGATMMIVTAVSKIYDDRNIALLRSNYHCEERRINSSLGSHHSL
ncbi:MULTISPECIES: hypothetical protein [unclassified Microcoleus]|uniref:hypothetical protein n=1 Tax=unclassified Microcoleus TaxID=2642155 RepID=UPI002FD411CC